MRYLPLYYCKECKEEIAHVRDDYWAKPPMCWRGHNVTLITNKVFVLTEELERHPVYGEFYRDEVLRLKLNGVLSWDN